MDGWRICELHLVFNLRRGTCLNIPLTVCNWNATCLPTAHMHSYLTNVICPCTVCQKRWQVCTSTNRWHWGQLLSIYQREIDTEFSSRLCSGVLRYVLMPCACRCSLLWKKRVEIHNKVFKMKSAVAIIMVFVGCCSNVVFLELLVK